jgi:hypothetical protein
MIDNPKQVAHLITKLKDALPLAAVLTPPLAGLIREQSPDTDFGPRCRITRIDYAGDEGGIVCKLDLGIESGSVNFYVSITHLMFDRRSSLGREIVAYQKHRFKRLNAQERAA